MSDAIKHGAGTTLYIYIFINIDSNDLKLNLQEENHNMF